MTCGLRRAPAGFRAGALVDHGAYRPHDADISGAAAEIAAQPDPYLALVRHGQAKHEVTRRDQHPRRAIPALQGMLAGKGGAKLNGDFVIIQPLDRGYASSIAGDGVSDAGARRHVVEQQRACPAYAMLAAEMGAGQIETVAQKISEMGARLNGG